MDFGMRDFLVSPPVTTGAPQAIGKQPLGIWVHFLFFVSGVPILTYTILIDTKFVEVRAILIVDWCYNALFSKDFSPFDFFSILPMSLIVFG